jgi:hypothetical protein
VEAVAPDTFGMELVRDRGRHQFHVSRLLDAPRGKQQVSGSRR